MRKNNKGFTLIELVLAAGLLMVVLTFVFSTLFFGLNTFAKNNAQYRLQTELRFATDFLLAELRNSTELALEDSFVKEADYYYIYINDSNRLMYEYNVEVRELADVAITEASFGLLEADSRNRLTVALKSIEGEQSYSVDTELLLNNVFDIPATQGKRVIKYKK